MIQILFELNLLNPSTLEIVVFIAFLHHLSDVIKRKQTVILLSRHEKLEKFRIRQKKNKSDKQNKFQSCIVHNFSLYSFLPAKIYAVSFGLDQHVPTNINTNSI